jgi:hypothetical protein
MLSLANLKDLDIHYDAGNGGKGECGIDKAPLGLLVFWVK